MPNRGQLAILILAVLAVGMAGFAWWFRYQQSVRIMEFWGTEAARLIRHSSELKVYRVSSQPTAGAADDAQTVDILGQPYFLSDRKDISEAVGLVHVRHFLIQDAGFDWNERVANEPAEWEYALDFVEAGNTVTVAFDLANQQICFVQQQRRVSIEPMADAIGNFLERQFAVPKQNAAKSDTPENLNE